MALNCCRVPREIDTGEGVTATETIVAVVTVNNTLEEIVSDVAEMVAMPGVRPFARPGTAFESICAIAGAEELQVTVEVMSLVLLSVNVPIAVNWVVVPDAIELTKGEMEIDARADAVTVREALPVTPDAVAVMDVVPSPRPSARPDCEIVAVLELVAAQTAALVRSWLLPSVYVPVATNC